MITLYERTDCPFCWKVRLVLAELGIDYKSVASELGAPHPEVRRLSPVGTVPLLVDGELVIWDSTVAAEYLAAAYPHGNSSGRTPAQQACERLIHTYSDKCVGPALRDLVFEKRSKYSAEWDQQLIESSDSHWRECQQWLEENWQPAVPSESESLNLAECAIAARAGVAAAYGSPIGPENPALYEWFTGIRGRPSWQAAYPTSFIAKEENLITI